MPSELMSGLLPEFLVLGAIVLLMLLEMLRVDGRLARAVFVVATGGGLVVLLRQISAGFGATLVPGEVVIDPFAMHARVVLLLCALGLGLGFSRAGGHKFWLLAAGSLLGGLLMMASAGFITLFLGLFDNDLRSALLPVDLDVWSDLFGSARAWHGPEPFAVVQLVWPDRNGWMPWESGFDQRIAHAQPVIGALDDV